MTQTALPLTILSIVIITLGIISLIISLLFLSYRKPDHSYNIVGVWIALIIGLILLSIGGFLLIVEEFS